jgi:hypothetical protein
MWNDVRGGRRVGELFDGVEVRERVAAVTVLGQSGAVREDHEGLESIELGAQAVQEVGEFGFHCPSFSLHARQQKESCGW